MKMSGKMLVRLAASVVLAAACVPLHAAEISLAIGKVEVEHKGRWTAATPGSRIYEGDTVKTGSRSLAVVELSPGSAVKLRENSTVRMEKLNPENISGSELMLTAGSVFTRVLKGKKSEGFRFRAGTVVASVRGTEFFTAFGRSARKGSDIWLCVNEGVVEVSTATGKEKELVPEGKGILVSREGKITPPKEYAWTSELNWNMDPSAGEVKDTTNLDKAYNDPLIMNYD